MAIIYQMPWMATAEGGCCADVIPYLHIHLSFRCIQNGESEADPWKDASSSSVPSQEITADSLPAHVSAAPGEYPSPRKKGKDENKGKI